MLKYYQICSNDDTGLTLTIFMSWSDLFPNASARAKAKHIVMYFQACSNSACPMHSGERYRAIGPLVDFLRMSTNLSKSPASFPIISIVKLAKILVLLENSTR